MKFRYLPAITILLLFSGQPPAAQEDPYERYINTSKDFKPVRQDKAWLRGAWPGWFYMPWTYEWTIGYDDASGKWSVEHGYNGAFLDHGQAMAAGKNKLAWIDRFELALRTYREQRWDEAMVIFEELVASRDDATSKIFIQRCRDMKANPPGENWDGVFKMLTK